MGESADIACEGLLSVSFLVSGGGGGLPPIQKGGGCSPYLLVVKKGVLVSLRIFSLKRFTVGAFMVPFRVLSRKKKSRDNVFF